MSRWQRDFPGFKLRLTRWGGLFLVLAIVLAFAALNSGNNGLMAVFGVALGSYVVSGAWSRQVLASATVIVSSPPEIFAGRSALFDVELANHSRVFPAYGLVIPAGRHHIDSQGRSGIYHADPAADAWRSAVWVSPPA